MKRTPLAAALSLDPASTLAAFDDMPSDATEEILAAFSVSDYCEDDCDLALLASFLDRLFEAGAHSLDELAPATVSGCIAKLMEESSEDDFEETLEAWTMLSFWREVGVKNPFLADSQFEEPVMLPSKRTPRVRSKSTH